MSSDERASKAKCEVCGTEYGTLADHSLTHHAETPAGADKAGNKEYWECTVCHKCFKDAAGTQEYADNEWVIPAIGGGETPAPGGGGDTPSGGGGASGGGGDAEVDAVQQVVDMINALAKPYDAAKVKEARTAYDKLVADQKADAKFTDALMKKLADAEEAVAGTEAQTAADKVSEQIAALPDDPAKAGEDQVAKAVADYKALSDKAKTLISSDGLVKLQKALIYPAQMQNVVLKSVKMKKGRKAVIKWTANDAVNGYELYLKAKGKKVKTIDIDSPATVKTKVKKLKAGKRYTVKIRTFTEVEDLATGTPVQIYGQWSNIKKAKAKK